MKLNNGKKRFRMLPLILCVLLLLCIGVGAVWAVSFMKTEKVENTFQTNTVSIKVNETYNGTTKSNVYVSNTGSTTDPKGPNVYIRVKLLAYWYEPSSDHIAAKSSWTPSFTPGTDWVLKDGYYYYKKPVAAGANTTNLISSITLSKDSEGYRQILEINAEGIQAVPAEAVKEAWGINVSNGNLSL